jgi:hypothetical protein
MKPEMLVLVVAVKIVDACEAGVAIVVGADEAVFCKGGEFWR